MKKVLLVLMSLLILVISGCTAKVSVESIDIGTVSLTVKDNTISADGIDSCYLDIKAYDVDGYLVNLNNYNIQAEVISSDDNWDIDDNWNFKAEKAGTYTIRIKIDGISSNTVTVTAIESNIIKSLNISSSASKIYADGTDYSQISVKAYNSSGREVSLTGKTALFYTTTGSTISTTGKFTATTAGSYNVYAKVDGVSSNVLTISVRRGLKIVNAATFSIHLITWEPSGHDAYWFTPSTEYSKFYPYDNGYVPTLKSGTSCQQEVIAGTSYLYFVLTEASDFGYYRTESKISVGTSGAADGRSFEFTNSTTGVETDENQNDIIKRKGVPVLREVVVSSKGVRSVVREIPLIKITKEEMNK